MHTSVSETFVSLKVRKLRRRSCFELRNEFIRLINRMMSPRGFPRIFGYDLQAIKYSISVPLDQGGFGGRNLMLTL